MVRRVLIKAPKFTFDLHNIGWKLLCYNVTSSITCCIINNTNQKEAYEGRLGNMQTIASPVWTSVPHLWVLAGFTVLSVCRSRSSFWEPKSEFVCGVSIENWWWALAAPASGMRCRPGCRVGASVLVLTLFDSLQGWVDSILDFKVLSSSQGCWAGEDQPTQGLNYKVFDEVSHCFPTLSSEVKQAAFRLIK